LAADPKWGDAGIVARTVPQRTPWAERMQPDALCSSPYGREAAFQAAGLLEMLERDHMALPSAIGRLWRVGAPPAADETLQVEVQLVANNEDGCTFDVLTHACAADGSPARLVDVMQGYRSIVLRPLTEQETFRRPPADGHGGPCSEARLHFDEVEPLLAAEAQGELARYLSAEEQQQFGALKVKKRRLDWLAGRLVAKRCIVDSWRHGAEAPRFSMLTIGTGDYGEPTVSLAGGKARSALHASPRALPRVSISHAARMAVALCSWDESIWPGIDVQPIKRRDPSFAKTYFTDAERAAVQEACAHPGVRAEACWTVRWALKEATLKALGIGARVDFTELTAAPKGREPAQAWTLTWTGEAAAYADGNGARVVDAEVVVENDVVLARVTLESKGSSHRTPRKWKTKAAS
jgi:phosphopantetheinyl transferase (holo-ACP synthase)